MTIYGGEETTWGARKDGFFVSCCKCGWHSMVEVKTIPKNILVDEQHNVLFKCNHCGNEWEEENEVG
jgi:DNA-directed RNA polymerase subunit M/transcription elongation factor TFIIS